MKKYSLLFLLLILGNVAYCQLPDWYKNLEKYWWYRYRLVNDFMKIGDKPGESIPAVMRNNQNGWFDPNYGYTNNKLKWGDATIDLGHYIATLATEYKQLANNGWPTARTEYELQYALSAFDRIDAYAEQYCYSMSNNYPGGYPGLPPANYNYSPSNYKNGFFVRDDVPFANFVNDNKAHFNRPATLPNHIVDNVYQSAFKGPFEGMTPVGPVVHATDWPSQTPRYPTEESQDQVADLFIGFALTTKYTNNTILQQQAADALYRIIQYTTQAPPPAFRIKNGMSGHCVYGVAGDKYPNNCNAGGADFFLSATPATKGVRMISSNWGYSSQAALLEGLGYTQNTLFQLAQYASANPTGMGAGSGFRDIAFTDSYVAFAKNWTLGMVFPTNLFNTSWAMIMRHSTQDFFGTPHIPLIYKLNYPGGGVGFSPQSMLTIDGRQLPSYEQMLNGAPTCGTHDYSGDYGGNKEWSGNDRLSEPYHRKDVGKYGQDGYDAADFNGLDYMLLYNLYALVANNYMGGMMNSYYRENYNVDYPTGTGLGSTSQKLKLNFLEYVSFVDKINNGGNVTFRGAKTVELLPGFNSSPGAVADIYVQDYNFACDDPNNEGDYHFAYVTTPIQVLSKGTSTTSEAEITEPIMYLPSGSGYNNPQEPDESWQADSTAIGQVTPEMENRARDSLYNVILQTGDSDLIAYAQAIMGNTNSGQFARTFSESKPANFDFTVYPNPNTGSFVIKVSKVGDYKITVTDMLGREVANTIMVDQTQESIHLTNVVSGTYIIELQTQKNRIQKRINIIK